MSTRPNIYASGIPRIRRGPQRSSHVTLTHHNLSNLRSQVATLSEPDNASLDSREFPESSVHPQDGGFVAADGSDYVSLSEQTSAASWSHSSSEDHIGPPASRQNIHSSPAQHQFEFSGFGSGNTRLDLLCSSRAPASTKVRDSREPVRLMMAQRARANPELYSAMEAIVVGQATSQQRNLVQSQVIESTESLKAPKPTIATQLQYSPVARTPLETAESSPSDGSAGQRSQTSRGRLRRSESHQVQSISQRGGGREQGHSPDRHPIMHLSGRFAEGNALSTYHSFRETIKLLPTYTQEDMRRACELAFPDSWVIWNRGLPQAPTDDPRYGSRYDAGSHGIQREPGVLSVAQAQFDGMSAFPLLLINGSRRPIGPSRRSSYSTPNLLSGVSIPSPPPISPYSQGRAHSTGSIRLVVPSDFDPAYRDPINAARWNLSSPLDLIQSRGHDQMHRSSSSTSVSYYTASSQPQFSSISLAPHAHTESPHPSKASSPSRNITAHPTVTGSMHGHFGSLRRSRIPSPLASFAVGNRQNSITATRFGSNDRSSGGTVAPSTTWNRPPQLNRPLATPRPLRTDALIDNGIDQQLRVFAAARAQARSSENTGPAPVSRIAERNNRDLSPNLQVLPVPEVLIYNRQVPDGPRTQHNTSQPPMNAPRAVRIPSVPRSSHTVFRRPARIPRSLRSSENEAYTAPLPTNDISQFPPLAVPILPPHTTSVWGTHSSRLPTQNAQQLHPHQPQRRRNATSSGSDNPSRVNVAAPNTNTAPLSIRTRGPRLPAWQQEQENSGEAEEELMMEEIRVRGLREGSGSTSRVLDVLDETPPRLGRFERRMMGL